MCDCDSLVFALRAQTQHQADLMFLMLPFTLLMVIAFLIAMVELMERRR